MPFFLLCGCVCVCVKNICFFSPHYWFCGPVHPTALLCHSQRFRWQGHRHGWMEEKVLDTCIPVYHMELVRSLLSASQLSGAQAVLPRSCAFILGFCLCPFLRIHTYIYVYPSIYLDVFWTVQWTCTPLLLPLWVPLGTSALYFIHLFYTLSKYCLLISKEGLVLISLCENNLDWVSMVSFRWAKCLKRWTLRNFFQVELYILDRCCKLGEFKHN